MLSVSIQADCRPRTRFTGITLALGSPSSPHGACEKSHTARTGTHTKPSQRPYARPQTQTTQIAQPRAALDAATQTSTTDLLDACPLLPAILFPIRVGVVVRPDARAGTSTNNIFILLLLLARPL